MPTLLDTALSYAARSIPVIPCKPRSKVPATRNGHLDASTDEARVRAWWRENPAYNVAIVMGERSGLWCLDVDGGEGERQYRHLVREIGPLTTAYEGSPNGFHLFFKRYDGVDSVGKRLFHSPRRGGLDLKTSGYVLVAPSVHPSGALYEAASPELTPEETPARLVDVLHEAAAWLKEHPLEGVSAEPSSSDTDDLSWLVPDVERFGEDTLRSMLASLDPDMPRDPWLRVGLALNDGGYPFEIWDDWSREGSKYDARAIQRDWQSFRPDGGVSMRSLLAMAYAAGWEPEDGALEPLGTAQDALTGDPPTSGRGIMRFLAISDLEAMPDPSWIVRRVFQEKTLNAIYGTAKHGKTFVALDLALCVATGRPWWGHAVEQGPVLYIAGEGVGGLKKRVRAWSRHHDVPLDKADFFVLPRMVRASMREEKKALLDAIRASGKTFKLIFIDTVARAMLGMDENDTKAMGLFVGLCDELKEKTGASVVVVHHAGKNTEAGMRGSTALLGAIDSLMKVSRLDDITTVVFEAQKDDEPLGDMAFRAARVEVGDQQSSLVMVRTDDPRPERKELRGSMKLALDFLRASVAVDPVMFRGRKACNVETWKALCLQRRLAMGKDERANRQAFHQVSKRLREQGFVEAEGDLVWEADGRGFVVEGDEADFDVV